MYTVSFMKRIRFYSEVLSIDICIGVLGAGALAQSVFESRMKAAWWFLLPISVWVVYTADHLLDALKVGAGSANHRHRFHHRHRKTLTTLAAIAATGSLAVAVIHLRELVILGGFLIGLLALMHILLAYWGKVRFGKELSVGVIYVCGVVFAPYLNRTVDIGWFEAVYLAGFLLAAYLNLFMNSVIEYAIDRRDRQIFLLTTVSRNSLSRLVLWAAAAGGIFFAATGLVLAMSSPSASTRHRRSRV